MSENIVTTWADLEPVLQETLQAVADGKIIFNPNGQKLQELGLVDMMPASLTLYPGRDFRLTPAGRECYASRLTGETLAGHGAIPATPTPTDDLAALQAENKRLRDALKTVLRKANSLAGYYPEPGDEREAYGMDAPIVFDDIRKTARVALEGGE